MILAISAPYPATAPPCACRASAGGRRSACALAVEGDRHGAGPDRRSMRRAQGQVVRRRAPAPTQRSPLVVQMDEGLRPGDLGHANGVVEQQHGVVGLCWPISEMVGRNAGGVGAVAPTRLSCAATGARCPSPNSSRALPDLGQIAGSSSAGRRKPAP